MKTTDIHVGATYENGTERRLVLAISDDGMVTWTYCDTDPRATNFSKLLGFARWAKDIVPSHVFLFYLACGCCFALVSDCRDRETQLSVSECAVKAALVEKKTRAEYRAGADKPTGCVCARKAVGV